MIAIFFLATVSSLTGCVYSIQKAEKLYHSSHRMGIADEARFLCLARIRNRKKSYPPPVVRRPARISGRFPGKKRVDTVIQISKIYQCNQKKLIIESWLTQAG